MFGMSQSLLLRCYLSEKGVAISQVVVCVTGHARMYSQAALDAAPEGSVVKLPAGEYKNENDAELNLTKALRIIGEGMDKVKLRCKFVVTQEQANGGMVAVQNLTIAGTVNVREVSYDNIIFASVEVNVPASSRGSDAFQAANKGKITLDCCEIVGGSDGVFIGGRETEMHIRETDIQMCSSRGIFANPDFVIQDSAVYNCGSYGIKGRGGWTEKGENQIQPGPWNSFGGPSGGYGF